MYLFQAWMCNRLPAVFALKSVFYDCSLKRHAHIQCTVHMDLYHIDQ